MCIRDRFVGGDGAVGGGWRLGGAVGYVGSHSSLADSASRTDVDSYTATIFGLSLIHI